jgi:hypothetical protein
MPDSMQLRVLASVAGRLDHELFSCGCPGARTASASPLIASPSTRNAHNAFINAQAQ